MKKFLYLFFLLGIANSLYSMEDDETSTILGPTMPSIENLVFPDDKAFAPEYTHKRTRPESRPTMKKTLPKKKKKYTSTDYMPTIQSESIAKATNTVTTPSHICPICRKPFKCKTHIFRHLQRNFINEVESGFNCAFCKSEILFGDINDACRHILAYHKDKLPK